MLSQIIFIALAVILASVSGVRAGLTVSEIKLMLQLVNEHRSANGLGSVKVDERLSASSQGHADDMGVMCELTHTGSDGSTPGKRATAEGISWTYINENAAEGQQSVSEVVTAWINSPAHNANLLKDTIKVAGFGKGNGCGNPYWNQNFASINGDYVPYPGVEGGDATTTTTTTKKAITAAPKPTTTKTTTTTKKATTTKGVLDVVLNVLKKTTTTTTTTTTKRTTTTTRKPTTTSVRKTTSSSKPTTTTKKTTTTTTKKTTTSKKTTTRSVTRFTKTATKTASTAKATQTIFGLSFNKNSSTSVNSTVNGTNSTNSTNSTTTHKGNSTVTVPLSSITGVSTSTPSSSLLNDSGEEFAPSIDDLTSSVDDGDGDSDSGSSDDDSNVDAGVVPDSADSTTTSGASSSPTSDSAPSVADIVDGFSAWVVPSKKKQRRSWW